jgi:hypothetical protein
MNKEPCELCGLEYTPIALHSMVAGGRRMSRVCGMCGAHALFGVDSRIAEDNPFQGGNSRCAYDLAYEEHGADWKPVGA